MTDEMIRTRLGEAALWEGAAEEAMEFGQQALKMARILRRENPTPATVLETCGKVIEEFTDVRIYTELLKLNPSAAIYQDKRRRLEARLEETEVNR